MLSNMATSLINSKRIFTTTAKAKELKKYVEPLITKAKDDSTHSRRTVFSYLQNKFAVKELFTTVAEKVADRPGGYTRIFKTHNRLGDNAEMCMIELVDFNELMLEHKASNAKAADAKPGKRTRRGSKKATDAVEEVVAKADKAVEAKVEVVEEVVDSAEVVEETPAAENEAGETPTDEKEA